MTSGRFQRHETVHERKFEWHPPWQTVGMPLYPTGIGYSRWGPGRVQVQREHPCFSIEVPLTGELVYFHEGRHRRIAPGAVLLKRAGSSYRLRPAKGHTCHKVHAGFAGPALPVLLDCWGLDDREVLRFADLQRPREAAAHLYTTAARGRPPEEIGAACYQLLAVLAEGRSRRRRPAVLDAALEDIRRRLDQPLTVDDLAARAGTSPAGLHRLFRRHLDTTPIAEVLRLRLERAAELLSGESDLLVKQVARSCGFADQRYFARMFKRCYGTPPARWRQKTPSVRSR